MGGQKRKGNGLSNAVHADSDGATTTSTTTQTSKVSMTSTGTSTGAPSGTTASREFGIVFNMITRIAAEYWRQVVNDLNRGDYSARNGNIVLAPENPGPGFGTRAYAIQYLAMYDALAGIMGQKTYMQHTVPDFPRGETPMLSCLRTCTVSQHVWWISKRERYM